MTTPTKKRHNPQKAPEPRRRKARRYTDQQIFDAAQEYGAAIIIPDFAISQRKIQNILYNSDGKLLLQSRKIEPLFAKIRQDGYHFAIVLFQESDFPAFIVIDPTLKGFRKRVQHGKSNGTDAIARRERYIRENHHVR